MSETELNPSTSTDAETLQNDPPQDRKKDENLCQVAAITFFTVVIFGLAIIAAGFILYDRDCEEIIRESFDGLKVKVTEFIKKMQVIFHMVGTDTNDSVVIPTKAKTRPTRMTTTITTTATSSEFEVARTAKSPKVISDENLAMLKVSHLLLKVLNKTNALLDNLTDTLGSPNDVQARETVLETVTKSTSTQIKTSPETTLATTSASSGTTLMATKAEKSFQGLLKNSLVVDTNKNGLLFLATGLTQEDILFQLPSRTSTLYNISSFTKLDFGRLCNSPEPPNYNVWGATGGLMENTYPLICGGINEESVLNYCHSWNGPFFMTPLLKEARALAASTVFNQTKLWITGGHDNEFKSIRSTEIIDVTQKKAFPGPQLPIGLQMHCLVKLSEKSALLSGGKSNDGLEAKTYLFDFVSMTWYPGPDLTIRRSGHSCGLLKDEKGATKVVVVGGFGVRGTFSGFERSIEILDIEQTESWEISQFREPVFGATMVSLGQKSLILIVNGAAGRLTCKESKCELDFMFALEHSAPFKVAMMVPETFGRCES